MVKLQTSGKAAEEAPDEKTETGGITDMIEVKNLTKRYGQNLVRFLTSNMSVIPPVSVV